tara:strand:- start:683 stop:898 length:216 start_codon:yes stop_codon:yes gene_type:complete
MTDSVERIKMSLNDRIARDEDWKDAVIVRINGLENKYDILMEKLHEYEDRLDKNERRYKKRTRPSLHNNRR